MAACISQYQDKTEHMGIKNGIKHDLVVRQQEKGHLVRWDWLMTKKLMTDLDGKISTFSNGHELGCEMLFNIHCTQ